MVCSSKNTELCSWPASALGPAIGGDSQQYSSHMLSHPACLTYSVRLKSPGTPKACVTPISYSLLARNFPKLTVSASSSLYGDAAAGASVAGAAVACLESGASPSACKHNQVLVGKRVWGEMMAWYVAVISEHPQLQLQSVACPCVW